MAWLTAGEKPTAAKLNAGTVGGLATTAGGIFIATGANAVAERIITTNAVATSESTSSTSFTDLSTTGPTVTVTTGVAAIVIITAGIFSDTGDEGGYMGFDISGSSSVSASINDALTLRSPATSKGLRASFATVVVGLTAGSNTFTSKYRTTGSGTCSFLDREMIVVPL